LGEVEEVQELAAQVAAPLHQLTIAWEPAKDD
jgi:hypothetical protein